MRMKIIEVASQQFQVEERDVSIEEVKAAKEVFISSTTKTILPVRQIDDYSFPNESLITEQLYHSMAQLQSVQTQTYEE